MTLSRRFMCLLAVLALVAPAGRGQSPGGTRAIGQTGVALTPAHFPRHSERDVERMFELGKEVGTTAVFIYQWSQSDFLDVAGKVVAASRAAGLTPILGLSPTTLGGGRSQLDVPSSVGRAARSKLSFAEPAVHKAYMRDALELAKLKPPYLCLATEINMLALKNVKEYLTFAHVYKQLYPLIKKASPDTKVFVSFQWDIIRMMGVKEPDRIKEHTKQIDVFRPELDLIALTSYPAEAYDAPSQIPADYYEAVLPHVHDGEEVMFMEIGWPSTGKGTEQEQAAFVDRLPALLAKVRPSIVDWSLLHDVSGGGLEGDLPSTGLADSAGRRKAAFDAFKRLR